MKLAIVKQGTTGLFKYASSLFSKCDLCLLFSSTTEGRHAGMYTECASHRGSLLHTMSLLFLTSFLFVCMHAYECAGADTCVHMCIAQRRILGRKELSLYRKPHHLDQAGWSHSWNFATSQCWSYSHMKLCLSFFFFSYIYRCWVFFLLLKIYSFVIQYVLM